MSCLGKELGSGAFGMVVQATAYGINQPGVSQQVAVKMLKGQRSLYLYPCGEKCKTEPISEAVYFLRCRKTRDRGEGGADVGAEDADSRRSTRQHRQPDGGVHGLRWVRL